MQNTRLTMARNEVRCAEPCTRESCCGNILGKCFASLRLGFLSYK